jgi:hypothetical protein
LERSKRVENTTPHHLQKMKLLSIGNDSKTSKGEKFGWLTGILYLAPSDVSGLVNTCPQASKGCRVACLYSAGRGAFSNVQKARIEKTRLYVQERETFFGHLVQDIVSLIKKAKKEGKKPCVRLNGTSDIDWENQTLPFGTKNIMEMFPSVQFYDYSKRTKRVIQSRDASQPWPSNYHLTFSRSESNQADVEKVLKAGGNVAMVFKNLPLLVGGLAFNHLVVDGDLSDLRFLDARLPVIVGLKAKGKAKKDESGFVL